MNPVTESLKIAGRKILRRIWVVILSTLIAASVALALAGPTESKYEARAVLVVPGSDASGNTRAGEASKLAVTYAELFTQDEALVGAAAKAAGVSRSAARKQIAVRNPANTSLLELTYRGRSPGESSRALAALVAAATGPKPATAAVGPNTLVAVRSGDRPVPVRQPAPGPIGAVFGMCLGVILALGLERSDARVDSVDDLADLVPCPAVELSWTDEPAAIAVLQRWSSGRQGRVTVALVPSREGDSGTPRQLGELFVQVAPRLGLSVAMEQRDPLGRVSWIASHIDPASPLEAVFVVPSWQGTPTELLAAEADTSMLVVESGASVSDVKHLTRSLLDFDAAPSWSFLSTAPGAEEQPGASVLQSVSTPHPAR